MSVQQSNFANEPGLLCRLNGQDSIVLVRRTHVAMFSLLFDTLHAFIANRVSTLGGNSVHFPPISPIELTI
jgi:hypothetical protein